MGERIQNGDEIVDDSGNLIGYRNPDGTNKYLVMSSSRDDPLAAALANYGLVIEPGTTLFVGPTDPSTQMSVGDVWIDSSAA